MKTIQLSKIIEGIGFDIKRMYADGISIDDISAYLLRKSKEIKYNYVR